MNAPVRLTTVLQVLAAAPAWAQCTPDWSDQFKYPGGQGMNEEIYALRVYNDGRGTALFAGGAFTVADGVEPARIARWDGAHWSRLGHGMDNTVNALQPFEIAGHAYLVAAGYFSRAGEIEAGRIAKWNGEAWSAISPAKFNEPVLSLGVYDDDGDGPRHAGLYAGGRFTGVGDTPASRIARWDGEHWTALGPGLNGGVFTMAVFDEDGPGGRKPALFVGGDFLKSGDLTVNHIARWDGEHWTAVGGGGGMDGDVHALIVYDDDGAGERRPALYAAGGFGHAGEIEASRIARWNGERWSALTTQKINEPVLSLGVFDADGEGEHKADLIAGGRFTRIGDLEARRIAAWNGGTWSALRQGIGGEAPEVSALASFRDPTGPALYAGGDFAEAGTHLSSHIARWGCLGDRVCKPDCNHDGKLDINDFICFQNNWREHTAYGDYDGNDRYDVNDFIAFQRDFAHGCD